MGKKASKAGLGEVLFSSTQRKVLGLLFGNPERSYFSNEVVRTAASGTGAVHRELAALEASGLVKATRVGKQKHYQANADSPIFPELRGIVLKTFGVADVVRGALAGLAPSIRTAFIYGSVAAGTDTSSSDVDLMVIADDVAYPELFAAASEAERRLGRKVNPIIYTPAELRRKLDAGESFATRVLEQAKIPLIGSVDGFLQPRKARRRKAAQG